MLHELGIEVYKEENEIWLRMKAQKQNFFVKFHNEAKYLYTIKN